MWRFATSGRRRRSSLARRARAAGIVAILVADDVTITPSG